LRWKVNLNRVNPHYGMLIRMIMTRISLLTSNSCEVQPRSSSSPPSSQSWDWLRLCLKS
jgi:hypothetical protein